jgi:hypothetical protein
MHSPKPGSPKVTRSPSSLPSRADEAVETSQRRRVVALRSWFRSPFFGIYLRRAFVLWFGLKTAAVILAAWAKLPAPLSFHAAPEIAAAIIAWLLLGSAMRRNGEDILLANLGFSVKLVFVELVILSLGCSLFVGLFA